MKEDRLFQSGQLTNHRGGPNSKQVSLDAAQTFATLNNRSMYAIPIILSDSKIPSVSKESVISSLHAKSSLKTNAADEMCAIPTKNVSQELCNCTCVMVCAELYLAFCRLCRLHALAPPLVAQCVLDSIDVRCEQIFTALHVTILFPFLGKGVHRKQETVKNREHYTA